MATDLSTYLEGALLNALRGGGAGTSFTAPAAVYVKLHTGLPGAAGTTNAAANTTRQAVAFGAATGSNPASITNTSAPTWTSVPSAETYTDVSLWDASTAGNCLAVGTLTASSTVAVGDNFSIPVGSLVVQLS